MYNRVNSISLGFYKIIYVYQKKIQPNKNPFLISFSNGEETAGKKKNEKLNLKTK